MLAYAFELGGRFQYDGITRTREISMRRVAVIGVGVTKFGRHELTSAELFALAAGDALADAAFRHAVMEVASGFSDVVLAGGAERILARG